MVYFKVDGNPDIYKRGLSPLKVPVSRNFMDTVSTVVDIIDYRTHPEEMEERYDPCRQ